MKVQAFKCEVITLEVARNAQGIADAIQELARDAAATERFKAATRAAFKAFANAMDDQDPPVADQWSFPPVALLMCADVLAGLACAGLADKGGDHADYSKAWALQRAEQYGLFPARFTEMIIQGMQAVAAEDKDEQPIH